MRDQTVSGGWQHNRQQVSLDVRKGMLEESELAYREFLHEAHDKLIDYAEKLPYAADRTEFHHARSRLGAEHNRAVRVFVSNLESAYRKEGAAVGLSKQAVADINHRELTLVDDETLEERVALSRSQQRYQSEFCEQLWALSQRLTLVGGGDRIPVSKLPMAPDVYCRALQASLSSIEIPKVPRLYLFKLFDRWFLSHIGNLYDSANNRLKAQGVLPNLRFKPERSTTDRYSGAQPRRIDPATDNKGNKRRAVGDSYEQLLNDIEEMQTRLSQGQSQNQSQPITHEYSPKQLLQATEKLQQVTRGNADKLLYETADVPVHDIRAEQQRLKATLQQVLDSQGAVNLKQKDMKTIDLVGMLFEYMLNDDELPDSVKAVLSYLHTPFLKMAFADASFFRQHEHPARLLLNAMADAGVRWVGSDGSSDTKVFDQIRSTVKQVMDEFDNEVKLFASLLINFTSYIQKVELRVRLMERRATEKARGEDRLREVKQQVNQEIRQRVKDRQLPSAILLFLLQPWTDYMVFLLLRYGEQSESWQQSLSLIEDLLWGLDIKGESGDHLRWRQHYPWVEATMQKGFETISYDRSKAVKLKLAMDKVYYQRAKNLEPTETNKPLHQKLVKMAEHRIGNQQDEEVVADREQEIIDKLRLMEFGTWFEFEDGHREKLAWFNATSQHYLFVDHSGKRTGIRTGQNIARSIIAGEMRMIIGSTKPLVERTLESIYSDLSKKAGAGAV